MRGLGLGGFTARREKRRYERRDGTKERVCTQQYKTNNVPWDERTDLGAGVLLLSLAAPYCGSGGLNLGTCLRKADTALNERLSVLSSLTRVGCARVL